MSLFNWLRLPQARGVAPVVTVSQTPYCMKKVGNEAEVTLYGDIVSKRPVDWSGKAIEGNFIILDDFLKDLKDIKDVSKLTVRINSLGGNAYDAIIIHNHLKELSAEVTVIVDGVAMSGGSLIMCAGDKVKVHAGSIIMIHKCATPIFDYANADELRKMAEQNDAVDAAQAAIYHCKTGKDEAELLAMMGNETYMTGQEAVDNGFADELIEGKAPDIAASADRRTLFYCGKPVWGTTGKPIPESIPVSVLSPAMAAEIKNVPNDIGNKGGKDMTITIDQLRSAFPEQVAQLESEARAAISVTPAQPTAPATLVPPAADSADALVQAERERIKAIDEIAPNILDKAMVEDAKYSHPCTAQELAFRAMKGQAALCTKHLDGVSADFQASGLLQVQTPGNLTSKIVPNSPEAMAAQAQADVEAYKKMKGAR